jgi:hypothetical protein
MGAKKVPPYTDLFWTMFFKIAPFLGEMNKELLQASDEIAIDAICDMIVKVPLLDDNNDFETKEIPLISADLQAMIDNMLYVSCYGHKAMFEDRVPAASRLVSQNLAVKIAHDKEADFYSSWADYKRSNAVNGKPG